MVLVERFEIAQFESCVAAYGKGTLEVFQLKATLRLLSCCHHIVEAVVFTLDEPHGLVAVGEEGEPHQAVQGFKEAVVAHLVIKFLGMENSLLFIEVQVDLSLHLLSVHMPMLEFGQLVEGPLADILRLALDLLDYFHLLLGQVLGE